MVLLPRTLYILITISRRQNPIKFETLFKLYHLFSWSFAFIVSITPIIVEKLTSRGLVYNDVKGWCWISVEYPDLRLILFYLPCTINYIFIFWSFVYVFFKIIKSKSDIFSSTSLRFILKATCYCFLALASFIPGSVNRLQNYLDPENPIFSLVLAQALITTLYGLFQLLIFILFALTAKTAVAPEQPHPDIKRKAILPETA